MQIELNRQSLVESHQSLQFLEYRQVEFQLPPIPTGLTPLFGREDDLHRLSLLVRSPDTRLITLTGPGGIGKTRLAIAMASEFASDPGALAGFLPLAHLNDQEQIPGAISSYLKLATCGAESLLNFFVSTLDQPLLLVMDNFEQIQDGGLFLVSLLAANPMLKILVTSRSRLHVRGEHEFHLGPLEIGTDTPGQLTGESDLTSPAVALFVERAFEVSPNFHLTAARANAIHAICHELDGFPLAIELAAARCRLMPPEAMLPLLKSRLSFLTGGPRDAPARHQTVRNTIQWTYDLLPPRTRQFFRYLSAFPGGFTFEAATQVAMNLFPEMPDEAMSMLVLEEIEILADFNLLRAGSNSPRLSAPARFRFYETIRTFGVEQLGERGEIEHANTLLEEWSLQISRAAAEPGLNEVSSMFDTLEQEYPNIRTTLEWLEGKGEAKRAFSILHGLAWFMTERYLLVEAIRWTNSFLAMDDIQSDPRSYAEALNTAAFVRYWCSHYSESQTLQERALAIWRTLDDDDKRAECLLNLGNVMFDSLQLEQAILMLSESLGLYLKSGNRHGYAHSSTILGRIRLATGEIELARSNYQTALEVFTELDQRSWIAFVQENLGLLALVEGDNEQALTFYRESLASAKSLGNHWRMSCSLLGFAELTRRAGELALSTTLYAATESSLVALEIRIRKATEELFTNWFGEVRQQLSPVEFEAAWSAGKSLDRDQATELALGFDPGKTVNLLPVTSAAKVDEPTRAVSRAGLTLREVEILELLSQGMSNREIAETLSISHRTVMQHLSNIFPKIDVTSRTAAAAWAHHNNIV